MQPQSKTFLSSGNLIADRRFEWARDCEAKGDLQGAAHLMLQTLELMPNYASAWFALGEIREKAGDRSGAIEAYRKAIDADSDDRHGALLPLMRLGAVPAQEMPAAYMKALFDQYSPSFDSALVDGLGYRAPALLRDAVEKACRTLGRPMRFGSVLDLGCGTGLAGDIFRFCSDWLAGVDISPGMIAQARAKVLYDRLQIAELAAFLREENDSGAKHHLVLAADVFVYVPDLGGIARMVACILARDGLFAFTVERHEGDDVILRETNRFAHSAAHVRAAAADAGLSLVSLDEISARTEKRHDVPGLLAVARLS